MTDRWRSLLPLLVLAGGAAAAQISPNGGEFQVNTYTTSSQYRPAIAADPTGNFVVVWHSYGSGETDTDSYSIQAQRHDANGQALGSEFQVNTYTTSDQRWPAVASNFLGDFVVVWHHRDAGQVTVQAQRFGADGSPRGAEFQVNSDPIGFGYYRTIFPAVAADSMGNFVVVWDSAGSTGSDSDGYSIQAQRYDANGNAVGGQFQVNSFTLGDQKSPRVASDALGNFVVAWARQWTASIQAQRYAANGAPLGGEFQVNEYTGTGWLSAAAANPQGNFVVAWVSFGSGGSDTSESSIQARCFDVEGIPQGGQFQVNSYTTGRQQGASVAWDFQGSFVVAWQSQGSSGSDTGSYSVQAQRYTQCETTLGEEFQVNSFTTNRQAYPAVALDPRGNFVVAWGSNGSSGPDADSYSIQAQRFDSLFRDGVESGDTNRWTTTVP